VSQSANPYAPVHRGSPADISIRKVNVRVFDLFQRSFQLLGDQYWLFLGITVLAMLIGSAVPLGLIMGPVLVGIYCCFIERERIGRVEFSTMFKGFEDFLEPFLAFLVILAVGLVVMVPLTLIMFVAILLPILAVAGSGDPNVAPAAPIMSILMMLALYPLIIGAQILIAMPFLFTFQLIADRNLKAIDSIKLSVQGVLRNFWGVLWCLIAVSFLSFLAALMCYFPMLFLMPVSFGVSYVLYRDIFGPLPELPPQPDLPPDFVEAELAE
jgi:hypothetical protein